MACRVFPPWAEHRNGLAQSLNSLSICLSEAGNSAAAREAIHEGIEVRRRISE
jgi:hypothetical protein